MIKLSRLFFYSVICFTMVYISCASSAKEDKATARTLSEYVVEVAKPEEVPPEAVAEQASPVEKPEVVVEVTPDPAPVEQPAQRIEEIPVVVASEVQPPTPQPADSPVDNLEQKPVVDTIEPLDLPHESKVVLDQAEFTTDFSEPLKENTLASLLPEKPITLTPETQVPESYFAAPVFVEPTQKDIGVDSKSSVSVRQPLKAETFMIMSRGQLSAQQLVDFFKSKNSKANLVKVEKLANLYIEECRIEGVNSDLAFAQMCHETGFLQFGGLVTSDMNNFCGLGAIDLKQRGERFDTEQLGVRAHVQHLKAYASTEALKQPLVDPRYRYVNPKGKSPFVAGLTGTWASDPKYHVKLLNIMESLYSFQ